MTTLDTTQIAVLMGLQKLALAKRELDEATALFNAVGETTTGQQIQDSWTQNGGGGQIVDIWRGNMLDTLADGDQEMMNQVVHYLEFGLPDFDLEDPEPPAWD